MTDEESKNTRPNNPEPRTLNPKLIAFITAIPILIALGCYSPQIIRYGEDIITALSIVTMICAGLFTLFMWLMLAAEYGYTDYSREGREKKVIEGILRGTGITSALILIAATTVDFSHLSTGLAAGLTTAGTMNLISGTTTAALEGIHSTDKRTN